ncbi:transcriptional regulator BetI [Shewanella sp. AS16]|uniref:transcriptional regulator BetI n=1 Tax=Shewanella sp. AS16 TaxID=2907625 RepID=UPI001F3CF4FB|nr:transcriptional regulator BetI [Shewanella sp. AS16]MCE9685213.1 transcriptional regulator BetI [Shewanella sp. AS16]
MQTTDISRVRKQQLVDATLASVAEFGLQNTTINSISRLAGMSSGIISHYFGGKQGLIQATLRHLLSQLKLALLERVAGAPLSPPQRLMMIVEANFTELQRSSPATKTWLSFWSQAMHDPALSRLQNINSERLYRNLRYSYRQCLPPEQVDPAAKQTAAMIDGFWLRSALSAEPAPEFERAEALCKAFIADKLAQYGAVTCH